jgi:hypothetical protein
MIPSDAPKPVRYIRFPCTNPISGSVRIDRGVSRGDVEVAKAKATPTVLFLALNQQHQEIKDRTVESKSVGER